MKCPKCGAQLQENAQFCFYCMEPLKQKSPYTSQKSSKKRKILLLWGLVFAVLAVVIVVVSVWPGTESKNENEKTASVESDDEIITTYDDFKLRATYLTGKKGISNLWDPDALVQTHSGKDEEGDTWQVYSTDVYIENTTFKIYFCENGTQVLTVLTDLTEETMEDGLELIDCTVSATYNYTFTNLKDVLSDRDKYPMEEIRREEQMLRLLGFPDPAEERHDEEEPMKVLRNYAYVTLDDAPNYLMLTDVRTRSFEGQTYYDLFVLHTFAQE